MSLLSSCNNMKNNIDYLNMGYNHTENIGKSIKTQKLESTLMKPESKSKRDFKIYLFFYLHYFLRFYNMQLFC